MILLISTQAECTRSVLQVVTLGYSIITQTRWRAEHSNENKRYKETCTIPLQKANYSLRKHTLAQLGHGFFRRTARCFGQNKVN